MRREGELTGVGPARRAPHLAPQKSLSDRANHSARITGREHGFGHVSRHDATGANHRLARRSNCALIATITVLADISTAATAGGKRMPWTVTKSSVMCDPATAKG